MTPFLLGSDTWFDHSWIMVTLKSLVHSSNAPIAIATINGASVAIGAQFGIATTSNATLVALITTIETTQREGLKNHQFTLSRSACHSITIEWHFNGCHFVKHRLLLVGSAVPSRKCGQGRLLPPNNALHPDAAGAALPSARCPNAPLPRQHPRDQRAIVPAPPRAEPLPFRICKPKIIYEADLMYSIEFGTCRYDLRGQVTQRREGFRVGELTLRAFAPSRELLCKVLVLVQSIGCLMMVFHFDGSAFLISLK
ncbi:MAG: hypothetical protein EOM24_22190 [Chloroflexia bacterium]|nr:hypothetical protein [Chloroflexia bacterium]